MTLYTVSLQQQTPVLICSDTSIPSCPVTVPKALWNALSTSFNTSQLDAIASICTLPSQGVCESAAGSNAENIAAVTLLQGPPGTGKVSFKHISLRN